MFDIVMPLFNKESYVSRTIEGVLAQSCADWRLFVVDDGSTDRSVAVVESFDDPRIKLIRQPNAGPGAARNTGILAGEAEWIAFLDADDLWMPNHLQVLGDLRQHFPSSVLIGTAYRQWTGNDLPTLSSEGSARLVRYFHEASRQRAPFYTSSAAFSRKAVNSVGLLEHVTVGDEMDLWARLALHGPVAASTRQTVLYRVGTGGITDSNVPAAPQTASLDQISLPVVTLMERLDGITDPQLRRDVMDYIDFDVGLSLVRAVRTGQIDYARKLLKLFLVGPRGKARVAAILARLPQPFGQRLLMLAFGLKRAVRLSIA
jgi:glycosyltransferase involved in cell wall biosynthesis